MSHQGTLVILATSLLINNILGGIQRQNNHIEIKNELIKLQKSISTYSETKNIKK